MTTFALELHTDLDSEYITVTASDITTALQIAQFMYPRRLVSIPVEIHEYEFEEVV